MLNNGTPESISSKIDKLKKKPKPFKVTRREKRTKPQVETPGESTIFIRGIPPELHHRFRAYCAGHNVSMKDVLLGYMQALLLNEVDRVFLYNKKYNPQSGK